MRIDHRQTSTPASSGRRPRTRDILRLLLLLLAVGAAFAQEVPPDWVSHEFGGVRFQLPPQWEERNRTADNILYSDTDADQTLMFGAGWEADPEAIVQEIRSEGAEIREMGERSLMGGVFDVREITGGGSGQPGWISQYIGKSPRRDGKRLIIQYGIQGRNSPGLLEDLFDQIASSLKRTGKAEPVEAVAEKIPEAAPPPPAETPVVKTPEKAIEKAEKKPLPQPAEQAAEKKAEKKPEKSPPSPAPAKTPPAAKEPAKAAPIQPASVAEAPRLTPEQQAARLFEEVLRKDDTDFAGIEVIYRRVMDEFPDTPQAQESYWRLANMYLLAFDPPRRADARAVLERYLERYPNSTLLDQRFSMFAKSGLPLVKERLLIIYEESGEWAKAAEIYAGFIPNRDLVTEEQLPFLPGYGKTLEKLGRPLDAIRCYRTYLKQNPDKEDFVARTVQGDLERLEGGAKPPAQTAPSRPPETANTPAPPTTPAQPAAAMTPPAPAQPAPAVTPDSLVEEARGLQAKGDYPGALAKYRASLALKPDPKIEERVKKLEAYLQTTGKK